jgi:hypothetical protein
MTRDVTYTTSLLGAALLCAACSVFEQPLLPGDAGGMDPHDPDAGDGGATRDAASSDDGDEPGDMDGGELPADGSADAGPDGSAGGACSLGVDPMDVCTADVVINEVDGSGEDFIELYNRGDVAVNVSNWIIADDSAGSPDVAKGVVIPAGTVIESHRYLYLWANLPPEPVAPPPEGMLYSNCISGTPPPCLHAEWGISSGGERLFLLDDALDVVCAVSYPGVVFGAEAFGRVTDGTDTLCATTPTAGEANVVSSLR